MLGSEIYHKLKDIVRPIHAHDEQLVAIAEWIKSEFVERKPIVRDCGTCKHQEVSKYVEPCYGCRDNDTFAHYEEATEKHS